jgi:hypothetical protein
MRDRSQLMESKLEVDQLRKQCSALQRELESQKKDIISIEEAKRDMRGLLNAAETSAAESRIIYQSTQEENRILKEKNMSLSQESIEISRRLKECDQQVYSLGLDKVFLITILCICHH